MNVAYSAFVIVAGVLVGGFIVYTGVFSSSDTLVSVLAVCIGLVSAVGSILIVYRASRLRLDEDGASSKSIAFKWHEITEVRKVGFGLHLIAGARKIVIAPHAYKNPNQLLDFVDSAVKRAS